MSRKASTNAPTWYQSAWVSAAAKIPGTDSPGLTVSRSMKITPISAIPTELPSWKPVFSTPEGLWVRVRRG